MEPGLFKSLNDGWMIFIWDMKILISEEQLTKISMDLIMEESPVKLGCHDFNQIKKYCKTLKFEKEWANQIIKSNQNKAISLAMEQVTSLSKSLLSMGGNESKKIAEKFSSSINNVKKTIIGILVKHYPQAVYASAGLGPAVDKSPIILEVCNVIYNEFLKSWDEIPFYQKKAAELAITKSNVNEVQKVGKEIMKQIISEIDSSCDFFYIDSADSPVEEYAKEKEKVSPKCTKVILIQDEKCNNIKPYNPNQFYVLGDSTDYNEDSTQLPRKTYYPKLEQFINKLV